MAKLTKQGRSYEIKTGTELLRAYQLNPNLPLRFGCCSGWCGVCKIKVLEGEGNLSKRTKAERELTTPPYRLACQCAILGDVEIE